MKNGQHAAVVPPLQVFMDKKPAPEGSLEAVNGSNAAVNGQQMMQAQPNAMAQPQLAAPQAGAPYYPPNVMSQHYPMMPGGAVPHGPPAQPPVWNQAAPPTYYNPYHQARNSLYWCVQAI